MIMAMMICEQRMNFSKFPIYVSSPEPLVRQIAVRVPYSPVSKENYIIQCVNKKGQTSNIDISSIKNNIKH